MIIPSHMAWGYVFGRAVGRVQRNEPNIPLLILAGGLPDFDLFTRQPYGTILGHHGISHSWLVILLLSIPFFYIYGARTIPYLVAVIQHPIFGDLIANRIPLFFPLTLSEFGMNLGQNNPLASTAIEISGFVLFLVIFTVSKDRKRSVAWTKRNLLLLILWIPPLLFTIYESFIYFKPDPITELYAGYALVSSLALLWIGTAMGLRGFRQKIAKTEKGA